MYVMCVDLAELGQQWRRCRGGSWSKNTHSSEAGICYTSRCCSHTALFM